MKLKTKWELKFVQRVDCLTLSRKFNWVVAAAAAAVVITRLSPLQIFQFDSLEIGRMKVISSRSQTAASSGRQSRQQSIQLTWQYDENKLHINSKSYFELVQTSAKAGGAGAASGAGTCNWFSAGLQFGCRRTGNYSESVLKCKRMCLARSSVCVCAACVYAVRVCVCCVLCILCMSAGNGDMTCNMTTEIAATAGYRPLLQLQRTAAATTTRCQIQVTSTLSSAWASAPAGFSFQSVL